MAEREREREGEGQRERQNVDVMPINRVDGVGLGDRSSEGRREEVHKEVGGW